MADYSSDIKSAYDDIKDAGVAITINRKATGTFIPSLGIQAYQTAELNANITDVDVTLTIKNSTGTFYTTGEVWIDSELISYTGISGNDLTGLTRGVDITDAAIHTEDSDVYLVSQDVSYSTYAVITDYKSHDRMISIASGVNDQSSIRLGDKKLLIPSYDLSIELDEQDIITIGSTNYMIVNIDHVAPNNDIIIYILHARGV